MRYRRIQEKGPVLLVTAEVHTGATLKAASTLLKKNALEHKTFTVLKSATPGIVVDYYVVETEARSLLPWPFSLARRELLDGGAGQG